MTNYNLIPKRDTVTTNIDQGIWLADYSKIVERWKMISDWLANQDYIKVDALG